MIDQVDTDDLPGGPQPDGQEHVLDARVGIAGRVIMEDHDGGGSGHERFPEDLTRVGDARVERARGHEPQRDQPVTGIEQEDAESLDRMRPELREQVGRNVAWSKKLRARWCGRQKGPSPELDGCLDAARLDRTDARQGSQAISVKPRQAVRASRQGKDLVGDRERACA